MTASRSAPSNVAAVTRGVPGRGRWVAGGVIAAVLGAALLAVFAQTIAEAFEGSGQELFNASVLGIAVVMLMWHSAWMASHGQEMAASMAAVGKEVTSGKRPLAALAVVVGLATLREGSEVVLFSGGLKGTLTSLESGDSMSFVLPGNARFTADGIVGAGQWLLFGPTVLQYATGTIRVPGYDLTQVTATGKVVPLCPILNP